MSVLANVHEERIDSSKGIRIFVRTARPDRSGVVYAGSRDKTLKLYEGHYHDLLNDVGKEQVLEEMRGWIDARLVS